MCVCVHVRNEETTSFDAFWGPINKELGFMNMEIRRVRYPYNKENYMGVVNKVRSELKQKDGALAALTWPPQRPRREMMRM